MCGPSGAMKALNNEIRQFSQYMVDAGKTVFGDASSVFNHLYGVMKRIVDGGPSQMGMSQNEFNAKNAAAVNAGAVEARNLKAAAASATAAIGGGNVAAPSGLAQEAVMSAEQRAAADTAEAENRILQENYDIGRKNFWAATGTEKELPSTFSPAEGFMQTAAGSQKTAMESQQEMDTASNWWANDIMKLGTAAIGGWAGGGFKLPGMGGKSSPAPAPSGGSNAPEWGS